MNASTLLLLVATLPLAAALAALALRRAAGVLVGIGLAGSAVCAGLLLPQPLVGFAVSWIRLPDALSAGTGGPLLTEIPFALLGSPARLLLALGTALIALLCVYYAAVMHRGEARRGYLIAVLGLFAGAMQLFLIADTLLLIYFAWELMGVCSFLLIAYPATPLARRAAREAFWTTRATDFGLLFAVLLLLGRFGWTTLSMVNVNALLGPLQQAQAQDPAFNALGFAQAEIFPWLTAAALLVLLATLGKLAMFPLSFWLAEAMAAPTPVSALLHAATMVAAGPILLTQLPGLFIYSSAALAAAVLLGGLSALVCAALALAATDAKRVLAYSTISTLSIAVAGVGVLSPQAAQYHILAHAWYKAPLFLAVGVLALAAAGHSTRLSDLSGAARRHPLARAVLVIGGLALAGFIGTGGYFGKEQVLLALLTRHNAEIAPGITFGQSPQYDVAAAAWSIGAVLLVLSLPLTAAYAVRLVGILGWGKPAEAAEEQSAAVKLPAQWPLLLAAAIGSLGLGGLLAVLRGYLTAPEEAWHWVEPGRYVIVIGVDVLLVLAGAFLAWRFNVARPAEGARVVRDGRLEPLIAMLADGLGLRRFWCAVVGRTGALLARRAWRFDVAGIDRLVEGTGRTGRRAAAASERFDRHVVDGLRWQGAELWWRIRRLHQRWLQTGSIQHYMFVVLACTLLLCIVALRPLARAFGEILGRM